MNYDSTFEQFKSQIQNVDKEALEGEIMGERYKVNLLRDKCIKKIDEIQVARKSANVSVGFE